MAFEYTVSAYGRYRLFFFNTSEVQYLVCTLLLLWLEGQIDTTRKTKKYMKKLRSMTYHNETMEELFSARI